MSQRECAATAGPSETGPRTRRSEVGIGGRIARHCQERGLIVRPIAHLNVMSPPLILDREQIDTMVGILHESIQATMDELVRENLWSG